MTLDTKRKLVAALLALVAAWVPGHALVVARLELDPWKWFGWAMYTVPKPVVRTYAVAMPGQRRLGVAELPPDERAGVLAAYGRFTERRIQFGSRSEPDEFATVLFDAYPDVDELVVQVQTLALNRETAVLERVSVDSYEYARGDG